MPDLTSMKNIGAEMARKLAAVGVRTPEELAEAGAKDAFFRLKTLYPGVCLVHLYALEGAVDVGGRLIVLCRRLIKESERRRREGT